MIIRAEPSIAFNYPLADQWTPFEGRVEFKPTEHDWDDPEHGPTPGAEISGQSSESSDDSAPYPHPQKPSKEKPHWMEWVPIKKTSADGKVLRPHIVVTRDNAKVFGVPFDDTPKVDLDPETFEDAQIDPYADIAGPIEVSRMNLNDTSKKIFGAHLQLGSRKAWGTTYVVSQTPSQKRHRVLGRKLLAPTKEDAEHRKT